MAKLLAGAPCAVLNQGALLTPAMLSSGAAAASSPTAATPPVPRGASMIWHLWLLLVPSPKAQGFPLSTGQPPAWTVWWAFYCEVPQGSSPSTVQGTVLGSAPSPRQGSCSFTTSFHDRIVLGCHRHPAGLGSAGVFEGSPKPLQDISQAGAIAGAGLQHGDGLCSTGHDVLHAEQ